MKASGKITAVVEGKDGKFYSKVLPIEVSKGGCGGWFNSTHPQLKPINIKN